MRVLLIELDYHPEVARGILVHLQDSSIKLGLVTRKRIFDQISVDTELDDLFLLEGNENIVAFFEKNKILDLSWNLILFTTAQTNFKALNKLSFRAPIAVIVHNIHAYFDRKKIKLRWSPFFLWKDFSFIVRIILLKSDWHHRKKFLDRVDRFLFPADFMLRYAYEHYPYYSNRFVDKTISWVSTKKLQQPSKDFFGITIIGTIDRRRRDYDQVIKLIQFLRLRVPNKVRITLAGKPFGRYGRQVLKEVEALASDKIIVSTYQSFVPDEEMIRIVEETDLLIAPIVAETRHRIWTEYYGKTKISGNINNAIEYWKPTLIPSFYPIKSELNLIMHKYDDQNHLCNKVLHFIKMNNISGRKEGNISKINTQKELLNSLDLAFMSSINHDDSIQ